MGHGPLDFVMLAMPPKCKRCGTFQGFDTGDSREVLVKRVQLQMEEELLRSEREPFKWFIRHNTNEEQEAYESERKRIRVKY